MTATGGLLSPHFTWPEFIQTQHRFFLNEQEEADAQVRANAVRLARDVLEPARALVGKLRITSGYRCQRLNECVGGAPRSAHIEGRAADVLPVEMDIRDAMRRLAESAIPFERIIYEHGRWIHLQAPAHAHEAPRLAFMTWGERRRDELGRLVTVYEPWDANDPRVRRVA